MENMKYLGKARVGICLPGLAHTRLQFCPEHYTSKKDELLFLPLSYTIVKDFVYQAILEWYFLLFWYIKD